MENNSKETENEVNNNNDDKVPKVAGPAQGKVTPKSAPKAKPAQKPEHAYTTSYGQHGQYGPYGPYGSYGSYGPYGPNIPYGQVHHHYYYEAPRPKKGRSSKPTIAGALLIITAILGLLASVMFVSSGLMFSEADSEGFSFWNMPDNGDVYGRVTYLNGTGVAGVTISIVDEDITTTTDNDGYYILYNVPTGNQELKVEKQGYNTFIKKIFVSPSEAGVNWQDDARKNNNHDSDSDSSNDGSSSNLHNFQLTEGEETIERGYYPPWNMISGMIYICGILIVIFSIISLLGGYFAIKRKKFGLAVAGSILGIFTFFGSLFAIIALFILLLSRDEFKRSETEVEETK